MKKHQGAGDITKELDNTSKERRKTIQAEPEKKTKTAVNRS